MGFRSHDPASSPVSVNPYKSFYVFELGTSDPGLLPNWGWSLGLGTGLGNDPPENLRHPGHLRSTHLGTHVRESHFPHDTSAPSPYLGTRQADGRSHKRASVPVPALSPPPLNGLSSMPVASYTAVSVVSYIRIHRVQLIPEVTYLPELATYIQIIASRSSTILPLAPVRCETAGHQEAASSIIFP